MTTNSVATTGAHVVKVGDFPDFPEMALPEAVSTSLQAVLDAAVAKTPSLALLPRWP